MADAAKKKSPTDVLAEIRTQLAKVLAAWPGADADTKAPPDSTTLADALAAQPEDMAVTARKKYDAIIRWIVGIFGAIALLIFGSLPFTDVKNIDWSTQAGRGVGLAGLGLTIVIWATTRALEPQDATLGELADSFGRITRAQRAERSTEPQGLDRLTQKVHDAYRFLLRRRNALGPRNRALRRLHRILTTGQEGEAHLGPGVRSVGELIQRIAALEKLEQELRVADDGSPSLIHGVAWSRSLVYQQARVAPLTTQLLEGYGLLLTLANAVNQSNVQSSSTLGNTLDRAIADLNRRTRAVARELGEPGDLARALATHAAVAATLEVYVGHRRLILTEAALSQLRGMFRLVRLWLLLGAAATLAGGLMYATALANRADEPTAAGTGAAGENQPVTLTLLANTTSWKQLTDCRPVDDGDITELPALLTSSDDRDARSDGPFTAIVIDPDCSRSISVAEGDGSYTRTP